MPNWLKYVVSAAAGFTTGAGTAAQSGAGTKGTVIGGAVAALLAVGNLVSTAPKDKEAVEIHKEFQKN